MRNKKSGNSRFSAFLEGDKDRLFALPAESRDKDIPWDEALCEQRLREASLGGGEEPFHYTRTKAFRRLYPVAGLLCCIALVGVLLLTVSGLPRFGEDYPPAEEVADRYIEKGLEETGATNFVAGMILDYRAFDTLGESFVLFTALNCVIVLLRRDKKEREEERFLPSYDLRGDRILRFSAFLLIPAVFTFGIYIMLNGHLSPGGRLCRGRRHGRGTDPHVGGVRL